MPITNVANCVIAHDRLLFRKGVQEKIQANENNVRALIREFRKLEMNYIEQPNTSAIRKMKKVLDKICRALDQKPFEFDIE